MKVIHLLRKPLSEGTVASNTLKHGTGGLNIDATRVAAPGETIANHSRGDESAISKGIYGDSKGQHTHQTEGQKLGRWPANVILRHLDGCRCEGVKRVKGFPPTKKSVRDDLNKGHDEIYGDYGSRSLVGHADTDGKEAVANWVCVEGCPVRALDNQSGILKSGAMDSIATGGQYTTYGKMYERRVMNPASEGGASRFFKQVGGGVGFPL